MRKEVTKAIVVSASSDIGAALCHRWLSRGWGVSGTYRTPTRQTQVLRDQGLRLVHCDLDDRASVSACCNDLRQTCGAWHVLVLGAGTQEPVGPFEYSDFDAWEASIRVNFTNQLRVVRELLPVRDRKSPQGACVLFFAGGGTNNATVNYSAYTASKIALIKMCELLDAEVPDARFVIVGPGWVHTKIHDATLRAGARAGENLARTRRKLTGDECTPMGDVLDCCDWIVRSPRSLVGGRNFSVVHDAWGSEELSDLLVRKPDIYKLRRSGNDLLKRGSVT